MWCQLGYKLFGFLNQCLYNMQLLEVCIYPMPQMYCNQVQIKWSSSHACPSSFVCCYIWCFYRLLSWSRKHPRGAKDTAVQLWTPFLWKLLALQRERNEDTAKLASPWITGGTRWKRLNPLFQIERRQSIKECELLQSSCLHGHVTFYVAIDTTSSPGKQSLNQLHQK